MAIVPKSYLRFRDKFPFYVRWVLDIVVFIAAVWVFGFIISFLLAATRGV